jgi:leukotriene-A4 hydrolase
VFPRYFQADPCSWLNEGWTVYLERRIVAAIHKNDAYFDFSAMIGWKHLGMC